MVVFFGFINRKTGGKSLKRSIHVNAVKSCGFGVAKVFTITLGGKSGSTLYCSNYLVLQFDFIMLSATKAKCT